MDLQRRLRVVSVHLNAADLESPETGDGAKFVYGVSGGLCTIEESNFERREEEAGEVVV